jgi:hypothetical protein
MILLLVISMMIYYQSQNDAAALSAYAESQRICHEIAIQLSAVDAAGNGTAAVLRMPIPLTGANYSVFVTGANRSVAVSYGAQGTGCYFSTSNISSGNASSFWITGDILISNIDGGVVVG